MYPFKPAIQDLEIYCLEGNLNIIKKLIAKGADINKQNYIVPPLYGAIWSGSYDVVKYLLDKGVELTPCDNQNPLEAASGCGNPKIFDLLLEYGAYISDNIDKLLLNACLSGNLELVNRFIKESAEITSFCFEYACISGNLEVLKTLIKNAPEKYRKNLLPDAVYSSNPEIVEFLIEQDENINQGGRFINETIMDTALSQEFSSLIHKRYLLKSKNKTLRQAGRTSASPLLNSYKTEILQECFDRFTMDRQKVIDILREHGVEL